MSQSGRLNSTGTIVPSDVPINFVTDNGTAVASGHTLEIKAIDVTDDNIDGIQVEGGLVQAGASNRVQVQLTNRITGSAQTTDAVTPGLIYSFNLGTTPGTYTFFVSTSAYNVTDSLSASYHISISARTTGAASVLISANTSLIAEEGAMSGCYLAYAVVGNSIELDATGLLGKTINWVSVTTYTFAS